MSFERKRPKEILAEPADKETPEKRTAYLDAACPGDAELRRQVQGLLAAHHQSPGCAAMPARWPNRNEL